MQYISLEIHSFCTMLSSDFCQVIIYHVIWYQSFDISCWYKVCYFLH